MIDRQTINVDCLYVNGDSWVRGSELIDPTSSVTNHFDAVHETYRMKHQWGKLLADSLGLDFIDGSLAGGSNDYILRTTLKDVSQLRRDGKRPLVMVSWSQLQRFELPIGPDGSLYQALVSPAVSDNPRAAIEIWTKFSSDRSDLIRWLGQIISLDSFLKVNGITYFGTTVFASPYRILESFIKTKDFEPYLYQLATNVNLHKHMLNFSLESILLQYDNVAYGPGGHPLAEGHELLAKYIQAQLEQRYTIKTIQAKR